MKVAKDLKQKDRALKRFQEQIDLQQRQIEHLTADERGDMNEEALLSDLRAAFPDDQLERLGRGRAGGDILHRVCVRAGDGLLAEAGLIVYECKDTLSWGTNFLEQARKEGLRHKTPYLVIISRAFPRGQKMLCVKDGVVVVHPSRAVDLAHVMRRMVEEVHRAALTAADQATKSVELISYLGSPDFRQAFETLISSSEKLTGLLGKERDWHERTWSKRQAAYDEIRARTSAVDARIRAIIEKEPAKNGKVVALRRTATPSAVGR